MPWEGINIGDTSKQVAVDTVGGLQFQGLKLVDPTDGSDVPLVIVRGSQATVPVSLVDATGAALTMAKPVVRSLTPTMSTSPAYSPGDSGFAVVELTNAAAVTGGTGNIVKFTVHDDDDTTAEWAFWLFRSTAAAPAANSAWSLSDADRKLAVGVVRTTSGVWEDAVNGKTCFVYPSPALPFDVTGTGLFVHGVLLSGTPTHSASGLKLEAHIYQD